MIEERINRQLRRAVGLVFCMICIFFICGGILSASLRKAKWKAVQEQIQAETVEYRNRIWKQMEADFHTLSAIAPFLGSLCEEDPQALADLLIRANQDSSFQTIVYYGLDRKGVVCTRDQEPVLNTDLSVLSEEGRKVVEDALEGNIAISQMFESKFSQSRVFAYAIPVCSEEDELIGALAASDHIDIFSDILSGNTVLGGGGYIHLLDSQGNFLVRSASTVVRENVTSVLEDPYLLDDSRDDVLDVMNRQESFFSSFKYENKTYPFLLEPVGINGWYLFCVNTGDGLFASTFSTTSVVQATFAAVLLLVVMLMVYGYLILRKYNRSLINLAYFDPLTGAENLARFQQRLKKFLARRGGSVAVVEVRNFPFFHEIFGSEKANQLICQIKQSADHAMRADEFFCHDTADRFYLFLAETEEKALQARLDAFMNEITTNEENRHRDYRLTLYCGVTSSPVCDDPDRGADNMMAHVLFALDRAKVGHSNTIWFFDTELHKVEELENYVESHMHQALEHGEFKLYLQAKKELRSNQLGGAEALVRWQPSDRGMIFPNQFIPLFERNGFCVKLDLYMVELVCRQIRSWIDRGIKPLPISVNQSKLLFYEADYVRTLRGLIQKYRVPAELITLEILEGLAMENVEELNDKITQLHAEGFRVSLDDFGTGFSSLNTLGSLRINELKLDRSFLQNAGDNTDTRTAFIMRQIVQLACQFQISTVAEGVETEEDERLIRSIGCDYGQGYLYSRPIRAEEFDSRFLSGSSWIAPSWAEE